MKTTYIHSLILIIPGLIFQGCLFGHGNGSYGPEYSGNPDKYISTRNYEKEHPFVMSDKSVNVPLVSQKGQVNVNMNIVNGFNSQVSVGLSSKVFIEGGVDFSNYNSIEKKTGSMEVTKNSWNSTHSTTETKIYTILTDYELNLTQASSSINLGIGFYKCFAKNGRWEYHAGVIHGSAKSNYVYDFNFTDLYTNNIRKYSFEERRKFTQVYLQTDFGYVTAKTEGAIIARASWLNFTDQKFNSDFNIPSYQMNENQFVLQPAIHFAYGRVLRVYTNVGWNIPVGDNQLKWTTTNVQLGILIKIKDRAML